MAFAYQATAGDKCFFFLMFNQDQTRSNFVSCQTSSLPFQGMEPHR